ncbi:MAG: amidohydrolase [Candidatus Kapaibacterium sp.]
MFAEIHVERGRIRAILPCLTGTIIRSETDTFTYPGCHIYPGIVDNHVHLVGLGEHLSMVSLHDALSREALLSRLSSAESLDGWIRAVGWNETLWSDQHLPSLEELDAITGDVPLYASRIDTHSALVNTAALRQAGIVSSTALLIDEDLEPVFGVLPAPSEETLRRMIERASAECVRHGITEVHDMNVASEWLEVMRTMAESGRLPIRVQSFVAAQHRQWQEHGQLPSGGELLRMCGIKMFADGALGSRSALLRSPYADDASTCGRELLSVEEMTEHIDEAVNAGWPAIAIHAIGDAAVRNVIDAYAAVRGRGNADDVIFRIEHAQHVHPDDVRRMAEFNIVACVQPTHCISDATMAEQRLDEERCHWSYRWRSLIDAGVHLGAGSDFPIESPDPFAGMDAFIRRQPRGHDSSWNAHECITREEALSAFTIDAHATSGMEYRRGLLKVGFDADFTITDVDLLDETKVVSTSDCVVATIVCGVRRYER